MVLTKEVVVYNSEATTTMTSDLLPQTFIGKQYLYIRLILTTINKSIHRRFQIPLSKAIQG
jgi:hypothetical protein